MLPEVNVVVVVVVTIDDDGDDDDDDDDDVVLLKTNGIEDANDVKVVAVAVRVGKLVEEIVVILETNRVAVFLVEKLVDEIGDVT